MPEQSGCTRWNGTPNHVTTATCSAAPNRSSFWAPQRVLLGTQMDRTPAGSRCLPRCGCARRYARARGRASEQSDRPRPTFGGIRRARQCMWPDCGQLIRRQCRHASGLELNTMVDNRCARSRAINAQRLRRRGQSCLITIAGPDAPPKPTPRATMVWRIGNV